MTKNTGSILPNGLYRRLTTDPSLNSGRVIIFSTVDDSGFPHHGMISYYEITALGTDKILMIIYSESKSAQNMRKKGKVTLLFVDEGMSYYVKSDAEELQEKISEAPNQSIFELKIRQVLEDKSSSANITSGINYSGIDPGVSIELRDRIYSELKKVASQLAKSLS